MQKFGFRSFPSNQPQNTNDKLNNPLFFIVTSKDLQCISTSLEPLIYPFPQPCSQLSTVFGAKQNTFIPLADNVLPNCWACSVPRIRFIESVINITGGVESTELIKGEA